MFDDFEHVDVRQIGRLTEFCQVQLNDQGLLMMGYSVVGFRSSLAD